MVLLSFGFLDDTLGGWLVCIWGSGCALQLSCTVRKVA